MAYIARSGQETIDKLHQETTAVPHTTSTSTFHMAQSVFVPVDPFDDHDLDIATRAPRPVQRDKLPTEVAMPASANGRLYRLNFVCLPT